MSKTRATAHLKKPSPEKLTIDATIMFNEDLSEEDAATIIANIASNMPCGRIKVRYHRHGKSGRSSGKLRKGDQVEIFVEPESGIDVASLGWSARRAQKFVDSIASFAAAPTSVRAKLLDIITLGIAGVPLLVATERDQLGTSIYPMI